MDRIALRGGRALTGEIAVSGSKNACLPIMTAAILTGETLELTNIPNLADIGTMSALLGSFGVEVWRDRNSRSLSLRAERIENHVAHYDIVRKMRASVLALGPLLAREREAVVSLPGGCAIGARPVDIHLDGLTAMGAELELKDGYIHATAPGGLRGADITMKAVSVGATENLMCAATLAKGVTVLHNAAQEPEIGDLARCLSAMGARIEGAGTDTIRIEGVESLSGARHRVIADRIEMGTFMIAAAITGGALTVTGGDRALVEALTQALEATGARVTDAPRGLHVTRTGPIRPVDITTEPFPGFATDLQAQMMALLALADGVSHIDERIFENRFMHAPELIRMGADITLSGGMATVRGVSALRGAPVMATDLRASVSLILAGLAAEGRTLVSRIYHLDRGYENVEAKLSAVGADIQRISEKDMDAA